MPVPLILFSIYLGRLLALPWTDTGRSGPWSVFSPGRSVRDRDHHGGVENNLRWRTQCCLHGGDGHRLHPGQSREGFID